jgi:signal transduction histidine kinase
VTARRFAASHVDELIAAGIGALYVLEIATEPEFGGDVVSSIAIGLVFAGSLLWRRTATLVPLAIGFVIIQLGNGPIRQLPETAAFLVGTLVTMYSAGRYMTGWRLRACILLAAAMVATATNEPGQPFRLDDLGFFLVFLFGPIITGIVVRRRHERERVLEDRAEDLERQRDDAVTQERVRIARELHDVVAHAISVIVLQARGGRRMLDSEPEETRAALDTIERAGEQALTEMRRLLGLLRAGDVDLALTPQPGLAHVQELAEQLRASGLPVEIAVEGEARTLPPGIDVSAYRIVQEALTNALKHAGPAHVRVGLRYCADALEIEVTDDGAGTGNGGGSGHGLAGMRERVAVFGGDFEAGAVPGGGYTLRARLPIAAAR